MINSLKGKSVHQLIAEGKSKIGCSGSAPTSSVQTAPPIKPITKEVPRKEEQKKKEAPKPKVDDEEDFDLGGSLFD